MSKRNVHFVGMIVLLFAAAYWLVKHLANMSQPTGQGGFSPDLTPGSTAGDYSNDPPTLDVDNAFSVVGQSQ